MTISDTKYWTCSWLFCECLQHQERLLNIFLYMGSNLFNQATKAITSRKLGSGNFHFHIWATQHETVRTRCIHNNRRICGAFRCGLVPGQSSRSQDRTYKPCCRNHVFLFTTTKPLNSFHFHVDIFLIIKCTEPICRHVLFFHFCVCLG